MFTPIGTIERKYQRSNFNFNGHVQTKNYYGLDLSGTILHIKMIFMNRVLMAGFSAGVQVFQAEDGSRRTHAKKYSAYFEAITPVNILISMISLP